MSVVVCAVTMVSKVEDVSDALSPVRLSSTCIPDELCIEGDVLFNNELILSTDQ